MSSTNADSSSKPVQGRKRGNSIQKVIQYAQSPPKDHNLGDEAFRSGPNADHSKNGSDPSKDRSSPARVEKSSTSASSPAAFTVDSHTSLWQDVKTFKWMVHPMSSLKMMAVFVSCWAGWQLLLDSKIPNPLTPFLFISYPLPRLPTDDRQVYGKGWLDLCFLLFYVVFFSFARQAITEWIVRPVARWFNLRSESKTLRFMEQGYAFIYFSCFSTFCFYVMRQLPTYWYQTDLFWKEYPHWRMIPELKVYYLLELSYWIQQMLVLVLRLEKPRSDYYELIVHHVVTLWLVGWSYGINLTRIGMCIFFTMDFSDIWLALAKCINYTPYQRTSEVAFAWFLGVWTYFRHYLNLKMLWSVYHEWELYMPVEERYFLPSQGLWMAWWMKWQIFVPILLLQIVNLFWYFLIWRILFRILRGQNAKDTREEEEDAEEEAALAKEQQVKNGKAQ